jgi:hypothetical protein
LLKYGVRQIIPKAVRALWAAAPGVLCLVGLVGAQGVQRPEDSLLWRLLEASIWQVLGLVVLLVVGAWLLFWIRSRFHGGDDPRADDHQMLAQIGELRREGRLNDEEYRSIKGRIIERLDDAPHEAEQSGK